MKSIISLVFLSGLVSSKIINTEDQKQSPMQRKMPEDMVDEVIWPEILGDQKRIRNNSIDRQTPPFPENGFKLNLAIRYDKLFSAKFPGTEKIRYVLILDF